MATYYRWKRYAASYEVYQAGYGSELTGNFSGNIEVYYAQSYSITISNGTPVFTLTNPQSKTLTNYGNLTFFGYHVILGAPSDVGLYSNVDSITGNGTTFSINAAYGEIVTTYGVKPS